MDIALVEMVLVFGLVLGVALWQIISVHREIREDERRRQASQQADTTRDSMEQPQAPSEAPRKSGTQA